MWSHQGYIRHCEYYLKHGDWIDDFYGEYQEKESDGQPEHEVEIEDGLNGCDYRALNVKNGKNRRTIRKK